jgi:hypothetical protein
VAVFTGRSRLLYHLLRLLLDLALGSSESRTGRNGWADEGGLAESPDGRAEEPGGVHGGHWKQRRVSDGPRGYNWRFQSSLGTIDVRMGDCATRRDGDGWVGVAIEADEVCRQKLAPPERAALHHVIPLHLPGPVHQPSSSTHALTTSILISSHRADASSSC